MTGSTIADKIGLVGSVTALSPAQVADARLTLAELALATTDPAGRCGGRLRCWGWGLTMPSRRTLLAAALGAATVATAALVWTVRWFETGIDKVAGDDDEPGLWLERS